MQTFAILLTTYGVPVIGLVAIVSWVLVDRPTKLALLVSGAVALALVGVLLLVSSGLWFDPRPFVVDGQPPLVPHPADNGFPSDHATLAAAAAGVVTAYRRRTGIVLLVVAALVAASRVVVRVHHVPDVLVGGALGLLAAAAGVWLARLIVRRAMQQWPRLGRLTARDDDGLALERTPRRTMA
ncbi:MAG: phosphatase PAP2 family protein [Humibacillus sp.]